MAISFVRPETVRLDLPDGAWLIVKKRLNAGESRRMFSGVIRTMELGEKVQLDPEKVGLQKILIYLIDWSASDVCDIRGKTSSEVADAINSLDPDSFQAILKAIETHETEQDAAAVLEKNSPDGGNASSKTSPSAA